MTDDTKLGIVVIGGIVLAMGLVFWMIWRAFNPKLKPLKHDNYWADVKPMEDAERNRRMALAMFLAENEGATINDWHTATEGLHANYIAAEAESRRRRNIAIDQLLKGGASGRSRTV